MQILLVAATEREIAPFVKAHPSADILITGVGVHATTYQLTKRIHQFDHDMIIQAGIAGCIDKQFIAGKVFAVHTDRFADIGVKEQNQYKSLFDVGLADENKFPFSSGGLINNTEYLKHCGLEVCNALTANIISDETTEVFNQAEKYNSFLESMEGAAFHYVCLQEEVPFLQIRSVSNIVGERDKTKWFLQESVDNLCAEVSRIFEELHRVNHT